MDGTRLLKPVGAGGADDTLTAVQDVAVPPNPRHFTFDNEQRWMVVTAKGGFTSHRVTAEGDIGAATESKLGGALAEMCIDCVVLVDK